MMITVFRRRLFVLGVIATLTAACAPTAPPSPTAAPAKPAATAAPAKPAATTAPAKPAATTAPAKPAAEAPKPAATQPAATKPAEKPTAPAANNPAGPFMAENSAEWRAILDAGRKEGTLTVYGSSTLRPVVEDLHAAFESQFGIKVEFTGGTGSDAENRLKAEKDSGRRVGSVVSSGDTTMYALNEEGILEELKGLPNGAKIHPIEFSIFETSKLRYWPFYELLRGVYVNTSLVQPADEPKVWMNLLDPKWKGKIVMHSPVLSGGGHTVFEVLMKAPGFGEDFHRKLVAQEPLLVRGGSEVDATVARGERAIGFPGNIHGPANQPGSPLKWVAMDDGLIRTSIVMALVKDAPSPNAGKVYLNWLLSPEVQTKIASEIEDVPATVGIKHPQGYSIETLKLLAPGFTDPAEQNAYLQKAREIYGR
jgi:iron(III) transport system substrate-binding protein